MEKLFKIGHENDKKSEEVNENIKKSVENKETFICGIIKKAVIYVDWNVPLTLNDEIPVTMTNFPLRQIMNVPITLDTANKKINFNSALFGSLFNIIDVTKQVSNMKEKDVKNEKANEERYKNYDMHSLNSLDSRKRCPDIIFIKDKEYKIVKWKDCLRYVATFLSDEKMITLDHADDKNEPRLITRQKTYEHPSRKGKNYPFSCGAYLYDLYSASECVRHSKYLAMKFYSIDKIFIGYKK